MSGADPARRALDARVLAWLREPGWRTDEARFDALARELFAFQVARCAPYARFCAARGLDPERLRSWREIPAVPTGAFKEVALRSFAAERTCKTFRTSGTSGTRRGALHLDTLALYEASLLASFERLVLPDLGHGERMRVLVLAASSEELPDSSLSHMFGVVLAHRGDAESSFAVCDGALDLPQVLRSLDAAQREARPVALCGTAFAFVHLLDALEGHGTTPKLPPGSRVMETGGFKGRSRTLERDDFYAALGGALGVPSERILNQYGMTELGSQFYDSTLREPGAARRKLAPPWTRVRLMDPETGDECAAGRPGTVTIVDLANTGSVIAVQTADVGRAVDGGFELLGREQGAEARGCSIAADVMLGGGA